VVQQVNKEWDVNKDTTVVYVMKIRKLENKFSGLEIYHVIRDNNVGVDVELTFQRQFSFTSCITLPSRH
jgi:hypothetical protein